MSPLARNICGRVILHIKVHITTVFPTVTQNTPRMGESWGTRRNISQKGPTSIRMHPLGDNLQRQGIQVIRICSKEENKYASKRIVLIHLPEISTMEGATEIVPLLRKMSGTVNTHTDVVHDPYPRGTDQKAYSTHQGQPPLINPYFNP